MMSNPNKVDKGQIVLLRGGGDLASGVALRLHRVGIKMVITELAQPLAVRRRVAFSEAVHQGVVNVEGVIARHASQPGDALRILSKGEIPVLIDPDCLIRHVHEFEIVAMVDARMTKQPPDLSLDAAPLLVGLGPGFVAGKNCHAVIETNRGHYLGRVIWLGAPEPNTGVPGKVGDKQQDRVLRAPTAGILRNNLEIGEKAAAGEVIADVAGKAILAPFDGVLRGMLRDGTSVKSGMKVGDLDPRNDAKYTATVSEKSLAIGGGVLEALLTRPEIRSKLWC
jgi:xanthine dehydrogenase accessory factor